MRAGIKYLFFGEHAASDSLYIARSFCVYNVVSGKDESLHWLILSFNVNYLSEGLGHDNSIERRLEQLFSQEINI